MSSLLVIVIGQVDINRELVSLLSTGPLASYCTFINEIILCYVIFYDANKLVIHSFIQQCMEHYCYKQEAPLPR